ncbi:ATP-binding protein [Bradyrhizobium diazoefficiens]
MIELRRIILIDWYLFRAQQVDLRGMTAIIGPNGAGKSAIIDAVQTVLSGASMASIRFNPSAQSNVRSKRTLRDYCLGVVSLDEKGERSEPTRQHAYTYIILVFEDLADGSAVSLGVAFSASASRSDESCEARFIAKGAMAKDDILAAVGDDEVETLQWHARTHRVASATYRGRRCVLKRYRLRGGIAQSSIAGRVSARSTALPEGIPERAAAEAGGQSYGFRPELRPRRSASPGRQTSARNRTLAVIDPSHRGVEGPERQPSRNPSHRRPCRGKREGYRNQ